MKKLINSLHSIFCAACGFTPGAQALAADAPQKIRIA